MDLRNVAAVFVFVGWIAGLSACGEASRDSMDATDRRFAAFYAGYLELGGRGVADSARPVMPDTDVVDSLLALHELTVGDLLERTERYRDSPALWKQVLEEVRSLLEEPSEGARP